MPVEFNPNISRALNYRISRNLFSKGLVLAPAAIAVLATACGEENNPGKYTIVSDARDSRLLYLKTNFDKEPITTTVLRQEKPGIRDTDTPWRPSDAAVDADMFSTTGKLDILLAEPYSPETSTQLRAALINSNNEELTIEYIYRLPARGVINDTLLAPEIRDNALLQVKFSKIWGDRFERVFRDGFTIYLERIDPHGHTLIPDSRRIIRISPDRLE